MWSPRRTPRGSGAGKSLGMPLSMAGGPNLPQAEQQLKPEPAPMPATTNGGPKFATSPPPVAAPSPADGGQGGTLELFAGMNDPDASPHSVVVHLLSASQVPRLIQLNRTSLAPFVTMWAVDATGSMIGERAMWPHRPNTRAPVWNWAQDLRLPRGMPYRDVLGLSLHVELWDHDGFLPANPIGAATVRLASLVSDSAIAVPLTLSSLATAPGAHAAASPGAPRPAKLVTGAADAAHSPLLSLVKKGLYSIGEALDARSATGGAAADSALPSPTACTLQLRLVRAHPPRKRLYLLRHGESEWNRAQSALDLGAMYSQVDHPLSVEGRKQAEALAGALAGARRVLAEGAHAIDPEAAALRGLADVELCLCSPLTRALQTCLLALGAVLRERSLGVYLQPNARERVNPGSVDSFGCALGAAEIRSRLEEKTANLFDGDAAAAAAAVGGVVLDDAEVRSRWWPGGPESKEEVQQRLTATMQQIQYSAAASIVLVGHSHFFRELLRANLSAGVAKSAPELAKELTSKKLSNCGVACLELDFEAGGPPIVDVQLLAGTRLVA